jgi:hypothetical protein
MRRRYAQAWGEARKVDEATPLVVLHMAPEVKGQDYAGYASGNVFCLIESDLLY